MQSTWLGLLCCVASLFLGCGPTVPMGVKCTTVRSPGNGAAELIASLQKSTAGDCVVPMGTSYKGAFLVPAGVTLVAQDGRSVAISADGESSPALTLNGGPGSALIGITIDQASAGGVSVVNGPARIVKLTVRKASGFALAISCSGADCLAESNQISVDNADLQDSELGLAVFGARVTVTGGVFSGHTSTRLGYGYGVVARSGAMVTATGMKIEKNQGLAGVVIDGAGGTSLQLADSTIANNQSYGLWAQGLTGTMDLPKLVIRGNLTAIESNHIVGVGAINSTGILISDARIATTVKVKLPTGASGVYEDVGDGVGLFKGTGQTRLERIVLENNERSQMLVDQGGIGIIIPETDRVAGGEFKIVVQHGSQPISAPATALSVPGRELLVQAETLSLVKPP